MTQPLATAINPRTEAAIKKLSIQIEKALS